MKNELNNIIENVKIAYKKAISRGDEALADRIFNILNEANFVLNSLEYIQKEDMPNEKKEEIVSSINNKNLTDEKVQEIEKVKRKLPRWLKYEKRIQLNSQILIIYMKLSENNSKRVKVSLIENEFYKDGKNEGRSFKIAYNQMRLIFKNNHAKVFEENYGEVTLWEPVADFIIEEFKRAAVFIHYNF